MIPWLTRTSEPKEPQEPWPRKELDRPLMVLRLDPTSGHKTFFGYATNLSREGLRIDATNPREPGDQYELEIPLPAPLEGVAHCHCEVVWKRDWARHRSPAMGLKFLDLAENISADLEAWVGRETRRRLYRPDAEA